MQRTELKQRLNEVYDNLTKALLPMVVDDSIPMPVAVQMAKLEELVNDVQGTGEEYRRDRKRIAIKRTKKAAS